MKMKNETGDSFADAGVKIGIIVADCTGHSGCTVGGGGTGYV